MKNNYHPHPFLREATLQIPTCPPCGACFLDLPTEIIQHIYLDLPTVQCIRSLSLASRRFHAAYSHSSQKLLIASRVLETQYGPLHDATQLVTLNSAQAVHHTREPAFSLALAKQIVDKGHIVNTWVLLYPILLWRSNPTSRRTLTSEEAYRLRRALYRFWIYNEACADEARREEFSVHASLRHLFFAQFPTQELRELEEVLVVKEEMLRWDCCPSDSTIQRHYSAVSPTRDLLDFGKYRKLIHGSRNSVQEILVNESWGDNIAIACHISHLLQMTPEHLLHFRENCNSKKERERYIEEIEPWTYGQMGLYEYTSELRWDLGHVLGGRNDGNRRGGGVHWITWDPEEKDEEREDERVEVVLSEKMQHLCRSGGDFVVGW